MTMVESPCQSICALDGDDVCIGCFRSGLEISYWGRLEPEQQREVLERCRKRMVGESVPCLIGERNRRFPGKES